MPLPKKLRLAIKGTILLGAFYGMHYHTHNWESDEKEYIIVSKSNIPFTETIFYQDKRNPLTYVSEKRPFKTYSIKDGEPFGKHDGLVDKIGIETKGEKISLYREKDYNKHMEKFDSADQELKKAKQRFKKYLIYE